MNEIVNFLNNFKEEDTNFTFYNEYLTKVKKMTGPSIIHILNESCKLMDDDKCYLEIGAHRGSTLVAASLNHNKSCYGVDNFSGHNSEEDCFPFSSIEEGLQHTISTFNSKNVSYFKDDFTNFLKNRTEINGKKVQIYFYDGDHSLENTYRGLLFVMPLLADDAIVFLDDSANNDEFAVHGAASLILEDFPQYSFLKEWRPKSGEMHGNLWCGLIALKFNRNGENK